METGILLSHHASSRSCHRPSISPPRPKTTLLKTGAILDEATCIVKNGPDLGFAAATDCGDAGRFVAWMRGACSSIMGVRTMLNGIDCLVEVAALWRAWWAGASPKQAEPG